MFVSASRKGLSEFIGYTYKRDNSAAVVSEPIPDTTAFVDPVDDRVLLEKLIVCY